jgi:hypothetical protein
MAKLFRYSSRNRVLTALFAYFNLGFKLYRNPTHFHPYGRFLEFNTGLVASMAFHVSLVFVGGGV